MHLFILATALALTMSRSAPLADSTLGLVQIAYEPELTETYLGSPSIVRVRSTDKLLVSADRFGAGSGTEGGQRNVSLHVPTNAAGDDSWALTQWVPSQYWSSLFQLDAGADGDVFLLGTSTDGPAPLKFARSRDGGATWAAEDAAVIAGEVRGNASYETGPTAVVEHGGRVYRAVERLAPPFRWGVDYEAVVASAPVDNLDALTDPASWTLSPPLPLDPSWLSGFPQPASFSPGFLEGNMVLGPDGKTLYDFLRLDDTNNTVPNTWGNRAILLRYDPPPTNRLSFERVVELPGGHSKFVVRRHEASGLYITLSNPTLSPRYTDQRNYLVICSSPDLVTWTVGPRALLEDDTGLAFSPDDSVEFTGFHYVDWQFDGDGGEDIVMAVRTAYRGAVSYHNSNRITTKTIFKWRDQLGLMGEEQSAMESANVGGAAQ